MNVLTITVQRWTDFQHYRQRRPPWIKLYVRLLDDPEFRSLAPVDRCVLQDIWMLAAAEAGIVRLTLPQLAWRLRMKPDAVLAACKRLASTLDSEGHQKWVVMSMSNGDFRHSASAPLAAREQPATPETETETETESEAETKAEPDTSVGPPDGGPGVGVAVIPGKGEQQGRPGAKLTASMERVQGAVSEGQAKWEAAGLRRRQAAKLIFSYWRARLGHPTARLDGKRIGRLLKRLEENDDDVTELLYVIDGTRKDRHLMGQNDRNRKFDGIETIFRDRAQVERLAVAGGYTTRDKPHRYLQEIAEGAQ